MNCGGRIGSVRWTIPEIPGTGGIRKLRHSLSGRGKGGGAKVVNFHGCEEIPNYAPFAYAKSAKTDPSSEERRAVIGIAAAIKGTGKGKQ